MMHETVDHAIGALAWLRARRLRNIENTHARMAFYERVPRSALFPPPPAVHEPRRGRCYSVFRVDCENLVFDSPHVPLHPEEAARYLSYSTLHRFFVRRLRRVGPPPRRAVVYLHAWMIPGAQAPDSAFAAMLSRKLDCDVYNVEQVHHGRRQVPYSPYHGLHFFTADMAFSFEALRQAVIDARTVIRYLLASGQYDDVGLVGISLGGAIATVAACLEPDLTFALPIVSHIDIADALRHAPAAAHIRHMLNRFGVTFDELARLNHVLATSWLEPAIERERMVFMPATRDAYMRPEALYRQVERWPGVKVRWLEGGHITGLLQLGDAFDEVRPYLDALSTRPSRGRQTSQTNARA